MTLQLVMSHFWPCRVSLKAASGCRTCAHPGRRIGRVPSSFPSVWSSGCPPACCTCTFPLQREVTKSPSGLHLCVTPLRRLCGSFWCHTLSTTAQAKSGRLSAFPFFQALRQVEVYQQALVYEIIGCVTQGIKSPCLWQWGKAAYTALK